MDKILTSSEMKSVLTEILITFDSYCQMHSLQYFMCGGTLLGAVRHKGFIPWDDDIDVLMPRPDYNRLQVLIKDNPLKANYRLVSLDQNNSPYPFSKIEDLNTELIDSGSDIHKHLWIDIFPLDGVSQEMFNNFEQFDKLQKHYSKMIEISSVSSPKGNIFVRTIKRLLIALVRVRGANYYGKKISDLSQQCKYDECKMAAGLTWGYGKRECMDKSVFFPLTKLLFEGHLFYAPNDYHAYLRNIYGDYMNLPPLEQRISHNITAKLK